MPFFQTNDFFYTNSMKQKDFLSKLKSYVSLTAHHQLPKITANAIYFVSKQHPTNIVNKRSYVKILKEIKTMLYKNFGWSMTKIHKCFCLLNKLMEHMGKSS